VAIHLIDLTYIMLYMKNFLTIFREQLQISELLLVSVHPAKFPAATAETALLGQLCEIKNEIRIKKKHVFEISRCLSIRGDCLKLSSRFCFFRLRFVHIFVLCRIMIC